MADDSTPPTNMSWNDVVRIINQAAVVAIAQPLPHELVTKIAAFVFEDDMPADEKPSNLPPPYMTPPTTCALMKLPSELRRQIFAHWIPDPDAVHFPRCEDDEKSRKRKWGEYERPSTLDLMVLNKRICGEIAEVIYEERWFVVHVHEGLTNGGIEFLHAGRQPLQFRDCSYDNRFTKFTKDSDFGFDRIKKVIIKIFPDPNDACRHTAINTHYMIYSLCALLQRSSEDKNARINTLTIEFPKGKPTEAGALVGRRAIQRAEDYWWDGDKDKPLATSIHNISNIELVLRPFANLTGCQSVQIKLPPKVAQHMPTTCFVSKLEASMTSDEVTLQVNDELEMNVERAREAMEDYVKFILRGKEKQEMERMAMEECMEAGAFDFDDGDEPRDQLSPGKHARSLSASSLSGPSKKRLQRYGSYDDPDKSSGEEDEMEKAKQESRNKARQQEEWEIQQAIAASMGQPTDPQTAFLARIREEKITNDRMRQARLKRFLALDQNKGASTVPSDDASNELPELEETAQPVLGSTSSVGPSSVSSTSQAGTGQRRLPPRARASTHDRSSADSDDLDVIGLAGDEEDEEVGVEFDVNDFIGFSES
jgi:hypothetical protein